MGQPVSSPRFTPARSRRGAHPGVHAEAYAGAHPWALPGTLWLAAALLVQGPPAPGQTTVFRYSFDSSQGLPNLIDRGPAGNDATARAAAALSADVPEEAQVPPDAGDSSLDSSAAVLAPGTPSGAVTLNTLLLDNASIAAAGGFTMECWFLWNGGGAVNSIIDYAGTEKIVIDTRQGQPGLLEMLIAGTGRIPIGYVEPLQWHYVAVVFDTDGASQNDDGTIDGTTRVYLDGLAPANIVPGRKDNYGDSLVRAIGIGMHPMGFALDFFDGLVFEPRVSLGTVGVDDLLIQDVEPPSGTGEVFRYRFTSTTPLPSIPDSGGAGNDATAGAAAALATDVPDSAPADAGNRSLRTSGGAGALTVDASLLSNASIAAAGGFLMEAWFKWNGGGGVNTIIDYAGTERIVLDTASAVPGQVELEMSGTVRVPLGVASAGRWSYVAVIFSSGGRPRNADGSLDGVAKVFFDQTVQSASFFAATKDRTGDDRSARIGVGQGALGGDVLDGLIFEPRVRLGVVGPDELRYTTPTLRPGTLLEYSFVDGETMLPLISDLGPRGNDAMAGPGAILSPDIPTVGVPDDAGDMSLDVSAANAGGERSGATTTGALLLSNAAIAETGGFTLETWVRYAGGGNINSIIDYAGTEKITIRGGTITMQFDDPRRDYPIGAAAVGAWHYVAVVFDTGGAPRNPDGTVTGTLTTYIDSLAPSSVVADVLKSNFGDSLVRGIGIGEHPLAFASDTLDGFVFEPKISLGALAPEELQFQGVAVQPPETTFHYRFSDATALPSIADESPRGNDATAAGAAALSTAIPGAVPAGSGDRSLATAGGGATTDARGLLRNATVTGFAGFTMETWFQWNGSGGTQSVMDYAGTERIVVEGGAVRFLVAGRPAIPLGTAVAGAWHYAAVVFDTRGASAAPGGTIAGVVTGYFDGFEPVAVVDGVTKTNAGDTANLGVGIGQNPAGGGLLDGRVFEPRLTYGPLEAEGLSYVLPALPPATVFRYSFFEGETQLPEILDRGPAGNDATAGALAALAFEMPTDGVPADAGDSALDASDPALGFTGAATRGIDLLENVRLEAYGGFTMECWFKWNGGGTVNAILDYAGTEKIVIDLRPTAPQPGLVEMLVDPGQRVPVAVATPGSWHYVAVVFATNGKPMAAGGSIRGSVTVYFDGNEPLATTDGIVKSVYGDSLDRGIGVGMHPLGYAGDSFDGLVFEPRVTLGPLGPEDLLYAGGAVARRPFHRADADGDGTVNITDGIFVLNYLFLGGEAPPCMEAANADDDPAVSITDAIYILNFLFLGGSEPPPPGAPPAPCGPDPLNSESDLGCEEYGGC